MPRISKSAVDRRVEILEVARTLFARRGYANTSVQAVIDAVGIAKGTFYHHFPSKSALLDALVGRLIDESRALVEPLADGPPSALVRFNLFFRRIDAWKSTQRGFMIEMASALEQDANAHLVKRLRHASHDAHARILARILAQGAEEGCFDVEIPWVSARMVLHVVASLSEALVEAVADGASLDGVDHAHHRALERVLGAPPGSIVIVAPDSLQHWVEAMREHR